MKRTLIAGFLTAVFILVPLETFAQPQAPSTSDLQAEIQQLLSLISQLQQTVSLLVKYNVSDTNFLPPGVTVPTAPTTPTIPTNPISPASTTTPLFPSIPAVPPTVDLKVNGSDGPVSVTAANPTVSLTWTAQPSTSASLFCYVQSDQSYPDWNGNLPLSGLSTVNAITDWNAIKPDTYSLGYIIHCVDSKTGLSASDSVIVTTPVPSTNSPAPTPTSPQTPPPGTNNAGSLSMTFTADKTTVAPGQPVTFTWSATGALWCSGFPTSSSATSGTYTVTPPSAANTITYNRYCTDANTTVSKSITITISNSASSVYSGLLGVLGELKNVLK